MHDRRRAARFVALVAAALAVAGTSAATPPPQPTQSLTASGSVHLTAEHPVAVQPLVYSIGQGQPTSMIVAPHLGDPSTDGTYLVSIEPFDPAMSVRREAATGLASEQPTTEYGFGCPSQPCAARFGLVISWLDAPAGGASDVPWSVAANVVFAGSVPAGATPGTVTFDAPTDATIDPRAILSSTSSGKPVRLTEADRFRRWTVRIAPSNEGAAAHGWPRVTQARLSLAATQVAGEPITLDSDGVSVDRRARGRSDPPVQIRVTTSDGRAWSAWANARAIEFDPFGHCPVEQPCETTLNVDVAWMDGRPESAFEASWQLDLVAVDAEGHERPLTARVEAEDALPIASATTSGTFDEPGPYYQPQVKVMVSAPAARHDGELNVPVPGRALATVTATSVGRVPIPPDAEISVFATGAYDLPGGGVFLKPGETGTFAFELRGLCGQGLPRCSADGTMGAVIYSPNRNTTNVDGMVVRIEWSIEAGIATTTDGKADVEVEPQPTRRP